jgi:UDP:flavonoid glycosyltransferase YjiC (YdhE family)
MKVLLSPIGTFGDIAPIVAYGNHLQKNGNHVDVFSTKDWKSYIENNNLNCITYECNFKHLVKNDSDLMGKPIKFMKHFMNNLKQITEKQFTYLENIIFKYDCIIGSGIQYAAFNFAEYHNIPYYHIFHFPCILKSSFHTPPIIPVQLNSKLLNKLLWKLYAFLNTNNINQIIGNQRKKLKLSKEQMVLGLNYIT